MKLRCFTGFTGNHAVLQDSQELGITSCDSCKSCERPCNSCKSCKSCERYFTGFHRNCLFRCIPDSKSKREATINQQKRSISDAHVQTIQAGCLESISKKHTSARRKSRSMPPKKRRAPRRDDWIDWKSSETKAIILHDLVNGILPLTEEGLNASEAWEQYYKHLDEVVQEGVVYSQFEARLKDHRAKLGAEFRRAREEKAALEHDRALFPRQTCNHHGRLVFDMHPAKKLLRRDVLNGRHANITPSQLRELEPEYKEFDKTEFKRRLYQEIRYNKFLNYLEKKRQDKKDV